MHAQSLFPYLIVCHGAPDISFMQVFKNQKKWEMWFIKIKGCKWSFGNNAFQKFIINHYKTDMICFK